LTGCGWTLDDILDLSWEQIILAAEVTMRHRVELVDMVLGPVVSMMGGKYSKQKVGKTQTKNQRRRKPPTPKQKEDMLVHQFSAAGLHVSIK